MKKSLLTWIGALSSAIALLSSCASDPDSPGLEYMPDMYRSPAIEAYVDYGEVRARIDETKKDKLTAQTPPQFTVPYYGKDSALVDMMLPYHRLPNQLMKSTHGFYGERLSTADEYTLASADLKNPVMLDEKVLEQGKKLYASMCQHCHGEKGDGNGPMVTSGAYSGVPNYMEEARVKLSNGQMFYSIYYGKGMMGAHRSLLNKKEIWTLVHYVRSMQFKDYMTAGTVSDTTQKN
jgi:mono/diheme cytochrome c family protein